jgi:hypothetical protein
MPGNSAQKLSALFGHGDQPRGKLGKLPEYPALIGIGIAKNRVQGRNNRHAHAAQRREKMAAGRPAKDAELMLDRQDICIIQIEKVGRASIGL